MATFNGKLKIILDALYADTNVSGIDTRKQKIDYEKSLTINSGTGANQANSVYVSKNTVSGSGTDNIDLAGSLTDAFGDTITFTSIKGIIIYSDSGNGDSLVIGGGSNPFINWVSDATDEIIVKPGGLLVLYNPEANGYAVTASTGDILDIENVDASDADYDLILIGEV